MNSVAPYRLHQLSRANRHKLSLGKLIFTVLSALAELERAILIERVRAGMATAKDKGKSFGRPKRVFRRDVAMEMRAAGNSWRVISNLLGVPVSTIREACAEKVAKSGVQKGGKTGRNSAAV